IVGIITPFLLTDKPQQAKWLSREEKDWLIDKLAEEKQAIKAKKSYTLWQAFTDRDVLILTLTYLLWMTGYYGFIMWLPTIVKGLSQYFTNQVVGWLVVIPYLGALLAMIVVSRHSDKTNERRYHTMFALLTKIRENQRRVLHFAIIRLPGISSKK
ncbi:MAG: MFS transporter, partial [Firmicutes bacterium]|nr:MFS transporter [Bacillota bacterium]